MINAHTINTAPFRHYDVTADGQRFLLIRQAEMDQSRTLPGVVVVQHFDEELKTRVPVK